MNRYGLPYNVMANKNSWDKVPREPISVGNFILGALGIQTTSLAALYVTGFVATTLVTSAITRALMPSAPKMQEGLLGNFRQAAAPWDVVYGQVRKGGTITYMESTGDTNKYLHMIITLAGHEVEEIGDIYINDQVVTIDGSDEVTSEPWVSGSGGADKWITVKKFTGASNQDIYTSLSGMTDGPTFENEGETNTPSRFKGESVACIYVRLEYNRDVFASGIPSFSAVVKGKKVKDPRTDTVAYSANAALCIRDYLISAYGLNTLESSIDDTYFSTAANDCDASSGSGASNKFEINGVITTAKNIRTNLQDMVGSCVGNLYYSAGQFKLVAGVYSPSVKTLTLDDLRSEINLSTKSSRRDNFNSVQGTFIWAGVDDGSDSGGDWTQVDYPPITSSAFVTEDNDYENPLQLDLPLTTSSATAQRIAKQTLFRAREQMTFNAEFGMNAFELQVGDTVSLTLDRYGWDEKGFEVVGWGFRADQDAGDLRVSLTLRETSAAAFAWDGEEEDILNNNSNLPVLNAGLVISNLTASAGGRTQGDGTFINSAVLDWDDVANAYLDYYDVEWRVVGDTDYTTTTTTNSSVEITPIVDGVQYEFRVRAVTASGNTGAYATVTLTGGGDTTAPALPTSITAEGGFEYITIRWTNPVDTDLRNVEVWENNTNTTSGATLIGVSGSSEFVRPNLGVNVTKYYFLRSVDFSGNTSAYTTGVSATTTYLDDPDFENGIYSLFTEQGLYAIEDVTSLPASGTFVGEKVFNRTDGKLYQWTGSAWELVVAQVNAPDINGQLVTNQIQVNAITSDLIAANAITETKITSNAITTPKLAAGAVTAGEIAAGAVTAVKIASNSITSDKIVAGTIQANDIAAGAITANEIAGNTITGNKIVANTITGGLLATSGIITNSAQITDAVVTNAKIGNLAVSTIKIADQAVSNTGADEDSVSNWTSTNYTTVASVTLSTEAGNQVILWAAGSIVFGGIGGEGSPSAASVRLLKGGTVLETYENLTPQTASQTLAAPCVIASATSDSTSTTFHVQVAKANAGGDASLSPTMLLVATELKK